MRSKTSLSWSREVAQSCGVSFVNLLYLVPLIIDQNFCGTLATANRDNATRLRVAAVYEADRQSVN